MTTCVECWLEKKLSAVCGEWDCVVCVCLYLCHPLCHLSLFLFLSLSLSLLLSLSLSLSLSVLRRTLLSLSLNSIQFKCFCIATAQNINTVYICNTKIKQTYIYA